MLFLKKFIKSLLVTVTIQLNIQFNGALTLCQPGWREAWGCFLFKIIYSKWDLETSLFLFPCTISSVLFFFFLSQLQTSHSPVLLTAASWVPPCWDLVEVTQTRLAHHPKCEPACSLHRCEHDQGHAVDRWHGASRGALVHLPGMHGWNWLYQICHQSSGNEQSLRI